MALWTLDAVPPIKRIRLDALGAEALVLCSTHRLAHNLRLAHDCAQSAAGRRRWRPLRASTPAQWLEAWTGEAVLAGEVAADRAPYLTLSISQERILWERVIDSETGAVAEQALFDREGLALAAQEANGLLETWGIGCSHDDAASEETQQFLRWRDHFRRVCTKAGWLEGARSLTWQLDCLSETTGLLPNEMVFAGFDRLNPQELRLIDILLARGVTVMELSLDHERPSQAIVHALPDRDAECRAAAAWAHMQLAENPGARLAIVVPELASIRENLADILDEVFEPQTISPRLSEAPRSYNFSLGQPLSRQPIVAVALALLRVGANPRRIALADFGALLCAPYWSASVSEADDRARLDARMRTQLMPELSLDRAMRFLERELVGGLQLHRLARHLGDLKSALDDLRVREIPSGWALAFERILNAAGWPGERPLSSHEFQARQTFAEVLSALGQLDTVCTRIDVNEAGRRFSRLCRERIFQPETENAPQLEVMGMLEAAATPLDGLWVMGMNDHVWPPQARPNPLLPAASQRKVQAPNASAEVQNEFARAIHRRLLRTASDVRFSYAQTEGDRLLRRSPIIDKIVHEPCEHVRHRTLLETLAASSKLERIADATAPALAAGESVKGGTGLLGAQAICPAWAYYRYRLGAKALDVPVEGLDAADRGTLAHAALEHFWSGRGSRSLQAMDATERQQAVAIAVDLALRAFNEGRREEALRSRAMALERERLGSLIDAWLDVEAQRQVPFDVIGCEQRREVEIEGIRVSVVIDRVDELTDGRRVVLDYKTGAGGSQASWGGERISEPQLPIYATLTESATVVAVAFAKVRLAESCFVGIAAAGGLLPNVPSIDDKRARRLYPQFSHWQELVAHWQERIHAIALEIRGGNAAVCFEREADLLYCDVLPLLRLAERKTQMEGR